MFRLNYPVGFKLKIISNVIVFLLYLSVSNQFIRQVHPLRAISRKGRLQGICSLNLEKKFLPKDGKCQYSGFVPVKGSCTAYIPCVSFGGDLMKPMKRTECPKSAGLAFDIEDLRCRPKADVNRCLQRICFPEETMIEDGLQPPNFKSGNSTPAATQVMDEIGEGAIEDIIISWTPQDTDGLNETSLLNTNETNPMSGAESSSTATLLVWDNEIIMLWELVCLGTLHYSVKF